MQSKTKSGWPERISSSDDASYNNTLASIWHSGKIAEKCFLRHCAFGIPTSSLVATACRFSDESDTFSCNQQMRMILMQIISRLNPIMFSCCSLLPIQENLSDRIMFKAAKTFPIKMQGQLKEAKGVI